MGKFEKKILLIFLFTDCLKPFKNCVPGKSELRKVALPLARAICARFPPVQKKPVVNLTC